MCNLVIPALILFILLSNIITQSQLFFLLHHSTGIGYVVHSFPYSLSSNLHQTKPLHSSAKSRIIYAAIIVLKFQLNLALFNELMQMLKCCIRFLVIRIFILQMFLTRLNVSVISSNHPNQW